MVYLMPDDARRLLNTGLPCCVPWQEKNMQLAANLGALKVEPGVNIARLQNAAWEASRPTTFTEEFARYRAAFGYGWRR